MTDLNIAIALASFNGEKYIEQQIKSIQDSSEKNWTLIIGDDGSTDKTLDIIKELQFDDPRIILLEATEDSPIGYCQNFNRILGFIKQQKFDIFLLSDQDDYWHSKKLSFQLKKISKCQGPQLIYSDLEIVDEFLQQKCSSYFNFHNINSRKGREINYLLMENCISGCTIMGNRQLLEIALPFPDTLHNHDWWLALIASCTGNIQYINQSLIKYRQHANNVIGGQSIGWQFWNFGLPINEILTKHKIQFQNQLDALLILQQRLNDCSIKSNNFLILNKYIDICMNNKSTIIKIIQLYIHSFRMHRSIRWVVLVNNLYYLKPKLE